MPPANPVARLDHRGAAVPTTLVTGINSTDVAFTIAANTGWPTSGVGNWYVVLEPGTSSEEKVLCASQSAGVVNVAGGVGGRGVDGTVAKAHTAGSTIRLCWTAAEADAANEHASLVSGIHGAVGAVVGTTDAQTLTNKSISGATNTLSAIPTSAISGFDTQVRTSRLDQMAAPTAAVAMNSQRLTGLAAPSSTGDAARLSEINAIDNKPSAYVATTANINTATHGLAAIDGFALSEGTRVLVKNQTTTSENGLYAASAGAWTLTSDSLTRGSFVTVEFGTVNGSSMWLLNDATAKTWVRIGGPLLAPVQRVYTTVGTTSWTKPANLLGVWAEVQGGGGGGGGAAATTAGETSPGPGGQAGHYARVWIPATSLGATENVVVGAGGTVTAGAAGGTGGTSSFGTTAFISATGGGGGVAAGASASPATSAGGTGTATYGGSVSTNRVTHDGGDGLHGVRISGTFCWAGAGGGSHLGGITCGPNGSAAVGVAGSLYGGGGSGARNTDAQAARAGGVGGQGCVVLTEVYN